MNDSPATRHSLIIKLRNPADATAWTEFLAIYEPLVYRLARLKGLQHADANDLCQEVFQAVARSIHGWEPGRGSFRGWLSRIARNLLINFLTRRQDQPRGSGSTSVRERLDAQAAPEVDPSATLLFEAEYQRRLFRWAAQEVRGEIAPATWQAFWQTALEERPPVQVASELGLSVGAVYVARCRVLARIKQRVEHYTIERVSTPCEADDAC